MNLALAWQWFIGCSLAIAAAVALVALLDGWRNRPTPPPPPEPTIDPADWFVDLCEYACIEPPLVLHNWPTESGHSFIVLVTVGREKDEGGNIRPFTTKRFEGFAGLLRDCAGIGCTHVDIKQDPVNGGRCIIHVNGIRLAPWFPPEDSGTDSDPTTVIEVPAVAALACSIKGCDEIPTTHVLSDDLRNLWVCTEHVDPSIAHLGGDLDHHPFDDACRMGICDPAPSPHELDREWVPDSAPLLPLDIRTESSREGSELPPPDPTTARPIEAVPGSTIGAVFDALLTERRPLRRGTLAGMVDVSPTTIDGALATLLEAGAVERVGSLWQIASPYSHACTLVRCGREEDASE